MILVGIVCLVIGFCVGVACGIDAAKDHLIENLSKSKLTDSENAQLTALVNKMTQSIKEHDA